MGTPTQCYEVIRSDGYAYPVFVRLLERMDSPTQVCVRSCPNISSPAGRPFRQLLHYLKASYPPRVIIDWDFLAARGLARELFDSVNTDAFTGPQWENLFQISELVYHELVWEFFASFEFDFTSCRYDPAHVGVSFRLGGETRTMSLLELG
ncbi:hypothetical protein Tco_0916107 [Tanacetum coccineum]